MNSSTEHLTERQAGGAGEHSGHCADGTAASRRDALGVAAALVGGALSIAVAPSAAADARSARAAQLNAAGAHTHAGGVHAHAPAQGASESGEPCTIGYNEAYEDALAEADARFPEDEHAQRAAAPGVFGKPLRRQYRVSAGYGIKGDWLAGHHTGIDLAVPTGTPVYAVGGGTVVLAQWSGDYGNAVTVRFTNGHYVLYAHLSRIRTKAGARIKTGARIADSGSTGRATGPHLHLEIRAQRGYGSDVDPVGYLARRGVRLL